MLVVPLSISRLQSTHQFFVLLVTPTTLHQIMSELAAALGCEHLVKRLQPSMP